jgi:diguanylate cyclase (GGDEF)-like protein
VTTNPVSSIDVSGLAEVVASAPDRDAAFDALVTEVARTLNTRTCLFQRVNRGWRLLAQARGGLRVSIEDLHAVLGGVPPDDRPAVLDLRGFGEGIWTSIGLTKASGAPLVVLLSGDWSKLAILPALSAALPFVVQSVLERTARRRAERLIVDGYALERRLSRLGSEEAVSQRVVERVSQTLGAERVALAVYRPEENRLAIAATHGYAVSVVKDVRIEPGSWVVGHVYASGRPVVVDDIRLLAGKSLAPRPYRTFSFAAVPIVAGDKTVGVLSATDKRDGSAFDRHDTLALRTFGVSAALALVASRSETEAHRLAYAATIDSLTGLFNRSYFDARLHQEVERAKRSGSSLTVLMVDIDDFKPVNDTYGHQTGDAVLRMVGRVLQSAVRVFDICARYGGDEIAILMPSSDASSATACAERIRRKIADYSREPNAPSLPPFTVSIGVAVIEAGDTPANLLDRADRSLYEAKSSGKNRVSPQGIRPVLRQIPHTGSRPEGGM